MNRNGDTSMKIDRDFSGSYIIIMMCQQILPNELISLIADYLENIPVSGLCNLKTSTMSNDGSENISQSLEIKINTNKYLLIQYVGFIQEKNKIFSPVWINNKVSSYFGDSTHNISAAQMLQELQAIKNMIQKTYSADTDLIKIQTINNAIETTLKSYAFLKDLIRCKSISE